MRELEKILKEIDLKIAGSMGKKREGLLEAENIIRKHLSTENAAEIKRSSRDNDGWIPVEDRLPEDDIEVLITYADVDNENETGIDITTYGYATLGGNKLGYKEWRNPFPYFKGNYKVVAWRPLPEPYHLEPETEKPDWRQGILRKFDRRSRQ